MPAAIDWTPELETSVLNAIESGDTLRQAAEKQGISASAIIRHVQANKDFAKHYARVIEERTDADFESLADVITQAPVSTQFGVDSGWVQWQRVRVDTLKWMLSHRNPKKYGENSNLNVNVQVTRMIVQDDEPRAVIDQQIQPALPKPEFDE
jgi:hypothetical protein